MDNNVKKLLNCIGILVVILLIVTFILGIAKINNAKNMILAKEKEIEESLMYSGEKLADDVVIPNDLQNFFSKYNGIYSAIDIYKNFNTLVKEKIPHYYELCVSNKAEKVYKENAEDIKYWFGCNDSSSFEKLMKNLSNKIDGDSIELDTYSFEEGKTKFTGITTKCNLIAKYKINGKTKEIKLNVEMYEKNEGTLMKITIAD